MAHRLAITATVPPVGALDESMGGAPLAEPGPAFGETEKAARKRHKRDLRRLRDAERPPDAFERWRILAELVKEGNQIIDMVDHRARYSLVILGALNAGLALILSRLGVLEGLSPNARWAFVGVLVVYAAVTALCVYFAVECLRPRHLYPSDVAMATVGDAGVQPRHAPRGILFWETVSAYELDDYRKAWGEVRMEQLNAEVVALAHRQSRAIRAKYAILGRLFTGLVLLVVLAALLLGTRALLGVL
jgi:hypothetical protein